MNKKLLWIGVLVVLVAIVGYYFYNNRTEKSCPDLYTVACIEVKYKNGKKREVVEYYDSGEIKERNIYNSDGDLIETKYYDINGNDPIEYYENGQIKRYKTYYGNGQIQREENYNEEGNYDGKYTEYYSNGQILEEINYKNGELDGQQLSYYSNGQIEYERNWKDGMIQNNKELHYYENGKIKSEYSYKNGERDGKRVDYYKNGQIMQDKYYKDGLLDGRSFEYNEDGYVHNECEYRDGEEIWCTKGGLRTLINENGQVEVENIYGEGGELIQRILYEYDEDGNKKYEGIFDIGKDKSTIIIYYENGNIEREISCNSALNGFQIVKDPFYDNNELVCNTTGYYLNGHVSSKWKFKGNTGNYTKYYENGQIEYKNFYKDGELVNSIRYDENGKLMN